VVEIEVVVRIVGAAVIVLVETAWEASAIVVGTVVWAA